MKACRSKAMLGEWESVGDASRSALKGARSF